MKTKFIFLKENLEFTKTLVKIGVVPVSVTRSMEIYAFYTNEVDKLKMDRYENTAEKFKMQPRQVMNIIKDMEQLV